MSVISATSSLGSSLPASTLPTIDPALEPAAIRNGNQAAKNAYQTGLAFEQILVGQLTQEMTSTISSDGSSSDGLGGTDSSSSDSSGSTGGSGASGLGAYASMLPQALGQSVVSGGGTGVAMEIARSIDPALNQGKS